MAVLYLEAFQASGYSRYAVVARGILDDLLARFRMPGGGFASALDAESEGIEGLYYTWTPDEIRSVLGSEVFHSFRVGLFGHGGGRRKRTWCSPAEGGSSDSARDAARVCGQPTAVARGPQQSPCTPA